MANLREKPQVSHNFFKKTGLLEGSGLDGFHHVFVRGDVDLHATVLGAAFFGLIVSNGLVEGKTLGIEVICIHTVLSG